MKSVRKELDISVTTCDPCRFTGKTATAVKYCKDCNGHFCMYCSKSHIKASQTRTHRLISIDKRGRSPKTSLNFQERCHDHGAVLISYCESHDQLCCNVCVLTNHKECKKLVQLSHAASGNKALLMCKTLESAIRKLQSQFEETQTQKQEYIKSLEQQNDALASSIRLFRRSLNGILDKLEEAIVSQKDAFCHVRSERVKGHIKTCQTAVSVLDEAYKQLDVTLRKSDAWMFVSSKRVQTVVSKYSEVLSKIQPTPDRDYVKFIPDVNIEKFLGGLESLGEVKVETSTVKREYSPSIASSRRSTSDNRKPNFTTDVNVKLKTDKRTCFITGATFLFDGRIVLADDANRNVKLFGTDFKHLSSVSVATPPRDITAISHFEVAATLPNEKMIQMFEIGTRNMEKKKALVLDIECYGITFHESEVYVTSGWSAEREIQVINPSGELVKKIKLPKGVFRYPLYITIDPKVNLMIVSDYINGVVCLDMSGKVILQCKNQDTGSYYKGVAVAMPGQTYACIWQQNGVSRVHTDGRGLESVLTWMSSDRRKPLAIAYTSKTKRLILSFCGEKRDILSIYKFY